MSTLKHPLWGFFTNGVPQTNNVTDTEYISSCIFCERENKFYINIKDKLWNCKVCGESGNYLQFLEKTSILNQKFFTEKEAKILSLDRGLPVTAFKNYGIGWDGRKFTIPIYNYDKKFRGLKSYTSGHKLLSAPGTNVELFNAFLLKDNIKEMVYLCEGEWDVIALSWLLKELMLPGIVVGVPGGGIYKEEWTPYFYQRKVVVLYDNDATGEAGELKVHAALQHVADELAYIHWPGTKPDKYDVRDFIVDLAIKRDKPKRCFELLNAWLQEIPRGLLNQASPDMETGRLSLSVERKKRFPKKTFEEVITAFKEYLYMKDITPIRIMLATMFANQIDGEMIWMFLVAPPSSAKTELIRSLFILDTVLPVSSMTQNTLLSGFMTPNKIDVSLLKQLDGKVMAIKDFTSVLTMMQTKRDEIFGQLRDAYDGESSKFFGHSQHAKNKAKFGIIAGVTETIEKFGTVHQTLGERFLRYYIPKESSEDEIMAKLKRAMENTGHHATLRKKVAEYVTGFFEHHEAIKPSVPEDIAVKIMYLARFTARLRGFVDKDQLNHILYKPSSESPIRLCKQLFQLAIGLACVESREIVNDADFQIIKQVALGTSPNRVESVVKCIYDAKGTPLKSFEIADRTKYELSTVNFVLKDLVAMELVVKDGIGSNNFYTLSKVLISLIEKGEVYKKLRRFNIKVSSPT